MQTKITLHDDEFSTLWYYPNEKIIHHRFLQPVSGDAFRNILLSGLGLMRKHQALKWLSDDRLISVHSAEDSAWSQDYWLPLALNAGWKCWALLPPEKARGQINLARLTKFVGENSNVNIKIFADPEDAWKWLALYCDASGPKAVQ
jgi:hypothetical protein